MSFIDLMASDRWSESDILNRTEAMIASAFPIADQLIMNRKVTAASAGMYQLTDDEKAQVGQFNSVCLAARQAGDEARTDMALLAQVLDYEAANGEGTTAGQDVLDLVARRAAARDPDLVLDPAPMQESAA